MFSAPVSCGPASRHAVSFQKVCHWHLHDEATGHTTLAATCHTFSEHLALDLHAVQKATHHACKFVAWVAVPCDRRLSMRVNLK